MARGTTLNSLIDQLRAEAGYSLSVSLGAANRDVLINLLQRTQRRLWEDFSWPFLRIKSDIAASASLRYYNLPSNMDVDRIERVEFKDGGYWAPLEYGIGPHQLAEHDSDESETGWPVRNWEIYSDTQFESWPIPNTNGTASSLEGYFRLIGIRNLSTFVNSSDLADLDDHLLVLFAAAEILARNKAGDAEAKFQQAQAHYARIKARVSKSNTFTIGAAPASHGPRLKGALIT
jgi:hypothetical protein